MDAKVIRPKAFAPNPDRQAKMVALREYIDALPNGARRSFVEITQDTGIAMNVEGRSLFRMSTKRLGKRFLSLRGHGFEMLSHENAPDIAGKAVRKVGNALDDARETVGVIADRVLPDMVGAARDRLLHQKAVLDTLQLSRELTSPVRRLPPASVGR